MDHPLERLVGATTLQRDQVCSSDVECLVAVQLSMMIIHTALTPSIAVDT
jgi:hypothetical protein